MRKLLLFAMFAISIAAYAGAKYQYFIACDQVYATDASATTEQVLDLIDRIEAKCN